MKLLELIEFSALTVAVYVPAAARELVDILNSKDEDVNVKTVDGVDTKVGYVIE